MDNRNISVKTILVVEDEPLIGDFCRRVLTEEAFEVDIAVDGKLAQEMARKKQYDLCLIDIRTPVVDGKDLYRWLREEHPDLASRVIFTTGDIMSGDTERFLQQSQRPLLPKPFSIDELRGIVRDTLTGVTDENGTRASQTEPGDASA